MAEPSSKVERITQLVSDEVQNQHSPLLSEPTAGFRSAGGESPGCSETPPSASRQTVTCWVRPLTGFTRSSTQQETNVSARAATEGVRRDARKVQTRIRATGLVLSGNLVATGPPSSPRKFRTSIHRLRAKGHPLQSFQRLHLGVPIRRVGRRRLGTPACHGGFR